jgi:hypothetical protein
MHWEHLTAAAIHRTAFVEDIFWELELVLQIVVLM